MTTSTTGSETTTTVQVHRVFIRATAQAIWDAITKPEWNERYGYKGPGEYDLRPGGAYKGRANQAMLAMGSPEVVVDGEVVEVDPPRKLVQTWRFLWDQAMVDEGFTKVTWEIAEEAEFGLCRLTVTHELEGAPMHAAMVGGGDIPLAQGGGGWPWILSDLKTLLETGASLEAETEGEG
jgi:uncharacterized protein YndB with AHSA1/START domain